MKRVEVRWHDSLRMPNGWKPRKGYRGRRSPRHRSTGYLLVDKPSHVVLVLSLGPGTAADGIYIPRRAVRRIKVLR